MLPSLREERAATYSPLPANSSPDRRGHAGAGACHDLRPARFDGVTRRLRGIRNACDRRTLQVASGSRIGDRWHALSVDYEMRERSDRFRQAVVSYRASSWVGAAGGIYYGAFSSTRLARRFQNEGNGLTIEQWLAYASPESLASFMFQKPTAAKRLYFDVIPRTVDDYLGFLEPIRVKHGRSGWQSVWHIQAEQPPEPEVLTHDGSGRPQFPSAMLLNLAAVSNDETRQFFWGFFAGYCPSASPQTHPSLDGLVRYAVAYFAILWPRRSAYRGADDVEGGVLKQLSSKLTHLPATSVRTRSSTRSTISPGRSAISGPLGKGGDERRGGRWSVKTNFSIWSTPFLLGESHGPRLGIVHCNLLGR